MEDPWFFVHVQREGENTRQYYFPSVSGQENMPMLSPYHRTNHSLFLDDTIADVRKKIVQAMREDGYLSDVTEEELFLSMRVSNPGCISLAYANHGTQTMTWKELEAYFPSLSTMGDDETTPEQSMDQTTFLRKLDEKGIAVAVHEPLGATITYTNMVFPSIRLHPLSAIQISFLQKNGFAMTHNKNKDLLLNTVTDNHIFVCLARDVDAMTSLTSEDRQWMMDQFFPKYSSSSSSSSSSKTLSVSAASSSSPLEAQLRSLKASSAHWASASAPKKITRLHIEIDHPWNQLMRQTTGEAMQVDLAPLFKRVHASRLFPIIRGPHGIYRLYTTGKNTQGEKIPYMVPTDVNKGNKYTVGGGGILQKEISFTVNAAHLLEEYANEMVESVATCFENTSLLVFHFTERRTIEIEWRLSGKKGLPLPLVQEGLDFIRVFVLEGQTVIQDLLRKMGIIEGKHLFGPAAEWEMDPRIRILDMDCIFFGLNHNDENKKKNNKPLSLEYVWRKYPLLQTILSKEKQQRTSFVFRRVSNFAPDLSPIQRQIVNIINAHVQQRKYVDKKKVLSLLMLSSVHDGPNEIDSLKEWIDEYMLYVTSTETCLQPGFPIEIIVDDDNNIGIHVHHIQGSPNYIPVLQTYMSKLANLLNRSIPIPSSASASTPKDDITSLSKHKNNNHLFHRSLLHNKISESRFGFLIQQDDEDDDEDEDEDEDKQDEVSSLKSIIKIGGGGGLKKVPLNLEWMSSLSNKNKNNNNNKFVSYFFNYQGLKKKKGTIGTNQNQNNGLSPMMESWIHPLRPFYYGEDRSFLAVCSFYYTMLHHNDDVSSWPPLPVDDPNATGFRDILKDAIDLDVFVRAQNGTLLSTFAYFRNQYDDIDVDALFAPHTTTQFYRSLDIQKNPHHRQYLMETILAYRNFQTYLEEKNTPIGHEYLWDVLSMPLAALLPKGINLILLESNPVDHRVEMICPQSVHTSTPYDDEKEYIFVCKDGHRYVPLTLPGEERQPLASPRLGEERQPLASPRLEEERQPLASPRLEEERQPLVSTEGRPKQVAFPLHQIQGLMLTAIHKIMQLRYKPKSVITGEPLATLSEILAAVKNHPWITPSPKIEYIVDYTSQIIGVFLSGGEKQENKKAWIPCEPEAFRDDNNGVLRKYMDDESLLQTYESTLSSLYYWQNYISACRPVRKVIDRGIIVGVMTAAHQFVPTLPNMDLETDDLPKYYHASLSQMDKTLALHHPPPSPPTTTTAPSEGDMETRLGPIHLETEFYLAFRQKMKQMLWAEKAASIKTTLERLTDIGSSAAPGQQGSKSTTSSMKKTVEHVMRLLKQTNTAPVQIQFVEFDEEVLHGLYLALENKEDHLSCLNQNDTLNNNHHPFCVMGLQTTQLMLPKQNLMNPETNNESLYFRRLAEEMVRNIRIQDFMFQREKQLASMDPEEDEYALRSHEMLWTKKRRIPSFSRDRAEEEQEEEEESAGVSNFQTSDPTFNAPMIEAPKLSNKIPFQPLTSPRPASLVEAERQSVTSPRPASLVEAERQSVTKETSEPQKGGALYDEFQEQERFGSRRAKYNLRNTRLTNRRRDPNVSLLNYNMRDVPDRPYETVRQTRRAPRRERVEAALPLLNPSPPPPPPPPPPQNPTPPPIQNQTPSVNTHPSSLNETLVDRTPSLSKTASLNETLVETLVDRTPSLSKSSSKNETLVDRTPSLSVPPSKNETLVDRTPSLSVPPSINETFVDTTNAPSPPIQIPSPPSIQEQGQEEEYSVPSLSLLNEYVDYDDGQQPQQEQEPFEDDDDNGQQQQEPLEGNEEERTPLPYEPILESKRLSLSNECIDVVLPKIRGNKGTGWIRYFASHLKRNMNEIKLKNTTACKWAMMRSLYDVKMGIHNGEGEDVDVDADATEDHGIDEIKRLLVRAYRKWASKEKAETWFFLLKSLQKQGKSAMMSDICLAEKRYIRRALRRHLPERLLPRDPIHKESFRLFNELITGRQYFITDTDLWMFCQEYNIPVVLFNPSGIKGFTLSNLQDRADRHDDDVDAIFGSESLSTGVENASQNDSNIWSDNDDVDFDDDDDDDLEEEQTGGAGEFRGLRSIDWFRLNENAPLLSTEYYYFIRSSIDSKMNGQSPYSILSPSTTISPQQMPLFHEEMTHGFETNVPNIRKLADQFGHLRIMIRRRTTLP